MATGTHVYRNDAWQSDCRLEEEMKKFVKQGIKRKEILDFLRAIFLSMREVYQPLTDAFAISI